MSARTPLFCPNPACLFHCDSKGWTCIKIGFFSRKFCQPAVIQRYRCLHCRRTFSTQTFSATYWLHKPGLQHRIFHGIQSCSGLRQIADECAVSPSTVQDHISRLGRHCLLFQHRRRRNARGCGRRSSRWRRSWGRGSLRSG